MTAEEAIKLDKPKFVEWTRAAPKSELERVFSVCALSTHSQHWTVVQLELETRRHRVVVWSLIVMIVTAILAAIAAFPVLRSWIL